MSQMANLVAYDGNPITPEQHTFYPISTEKTGSKITSLYRKNTDGVSIDAQASVEVIQEVLPSGVRRAEVRINVPVAESVGGTNAAGYTAPPKTAYIQRVSVVSYNSPRSTNTMRRICRGLAVNILNGVTATATINATGPAAELFDSLIQPS